MQIIDKGGRLKISLLIEEGRRLRDAAYLARRAGLNIGGERGKKLDAAAVELLQLVDEGVKDKTKLDRQDTEAVPAQ